MIKLLIADDHQIYIDGIVSILKDRTDVEIIAQAKDGIEVIKALSTHAIDVLLLDINMPNTKILPLVKEIKNKWKETKIIVISMNMGSRYYVKLRTHINGYLYKTAGKEELITAITKAVNNEIYISNELYTDFFLKKDDSKTADINLVKPKRLSNMEMKILKLILEEFSNRVIADKLNISVGTVDTHRRNIMLKVGAKNTVGLVKYCLLHNIVKDFKPASTT